MKLLGSFLLALGWLGLAYTQLQLVTIEAPISDFVFTLIANVLTPIMLAVAGAIFLVHSIVSLPNINGIFWSMSLMALVPLLYFYAPLVMAIFSEAF